MNKSTKNLTRDTKLDTAVDYILVVLVVLASGALALAIDYIARNILAGR